MKYIYTILLILTLSTTASAGFGILLDCHGNSGIPAWATGDDVEVYASINGVWVLVHTLDFPDCSEDDNYYIPVSLPFVWTDVGKLRLRATDIDMVWFDKVTLTDSGGVTRVQWGVDDNTGYCVSAEDEGENIYCKYGQAFDVWTFSW